MREHAKAQRRDDGAKTAKSVLVRIFVSSWLLLAAPRTALACPVCFGNSDSPMAIATNNGILFMLGIVAVVLSAFATFFIPLIRRANRVADETRRADAGGLASSEGTAQC